MAPHGMWGPIARGGDDLPAPRDRRRGARRRHQHGSRGDPDARVHARRDEGNREVAPSGRGARARCRRRAREHVPPPLPAGRGDRRGARGDPRVLGLGAGRSSPTPAASRCSRSATRSPRSTTTASPSAPSTTATEARFTPEGVAEIQRRLGSDIAMCLDVCVPAERRREWSSSEPSGRRRPGRDVRSTHRARPGSSASGSRRARPTRSYAALDRRDHRHCRSTGSRSAASPSASRRTRCSTASNGRHPLLPAAHPRYFMGIGDPEGILEVVARGIDMFDCVLPTRTARTGSALTWEGRLNLRNASYRTDPTTARRRVRVPGLRALLACVHPPPRHAARDPGITPAEPA